MQKVINTFKSVDSFGSGVGFSVKGDGSFKTGLGAVITLIIYVIVGIYGFQKINVLKGRTGTAHTELLRENIIDPNETILMGDIDANFAFGLWSN